MLHRESHNRPHSHSHSHRGKRFAREDHHHDRHHGGRGRHRRGGWSDPTDLEMRRFFAHGDLRLVILRLIAEKPRHGYEIIKEIEERVAGAYSPSPGVIYPTLTLLEELGYVAVSPGEGARKLHQITDAGQAFLTANHQAVEALFVRMEAASEARGGGPAPQILRAMENLKLALRLRLSRGPLSEDQVTAVAEVLDAAAVSVERT
jgi:DNA-binding PadR family transcriptional regulator